jgi:hypothetical protein
LDWCLFRQQKNAQMFEEHELPWPLPTVKRGGQCANALHRHSPAENQLKQNAERITDFKGKFTNDDNLFCII